MQPPFSPLGTPTGYPLRTFSTRTVCARLASVQRLPCICLFQQPSMHIFGFGIDYARCQAAAHSVSDVVGMTSWRVNTAGGPPRFIQPFIPGRPLRPDQAAAEELPLMVYLPGIDGTGLAASRQFPFLVDAFDLHCLSVPSADRTPFPQLVSLIECAPSCLCLRPSSHSALPVHHS